MRKNKSVLSKIGFALILVLICLYMIIPIYIIVKVSFGTTEEVLTQHPTLLPHHITLEHWKDVLTSGNVMAPLMKSLIVATSTMVIAVLLVAPAAYAISRLSRKVKIAFVMTLFFTKMFPTVGIALPISVRFVKWGLMDSNIGLIMAHLIGQLPFMAWILVSTFSAIPMDLEEAATLDGCSMVRLFFGIVFPLLKTITVTVAILNVMWIWNDFLLPNLIINKTGWQTLPLKTYLFFGQFTKRWDLATAGLILCMIPIIIFYISCQRYIVKGVTDGAVKG